MPAISTIKLRRGTAAAWTAANPVLASAEEGFETDTGLRKIGDGATAWTSLSYDRSFYEPWTVDIDTAQSVVNTGWASPTPGAILYSSYNLSSGAQNAEIGWDVVLSAGTWTVQLTHYTINSAGIYSVRIDGVEVGTIDGYAASGGPDHVSVVTGIAVATGGKRRVTLKMATKNASSSSYYGLIQHLQLRRTA